MKKLMFGSSDHNRDMKNLYMAPMEGVTGYVFRNAYVKNYGPVDKFFTPFIANRELSNKEIRECDPGNNAGINLIPQILTNKEEDFVYIANNLKERFGYGEVNFNLGCPSGTVVARGRGAGFLRDLDNLDRFLDYIFEHTDVRISIKTRTGIEDSASWEQILEIYNRYPLTELIVHPRNQVDGYKGKPNMNDFTTAYLGCRHLLTYNGDVNSVEDYNNIVTSYPNVDAVMCGRGILYNPGLFNEIKGADRVSNERLLSFIEDVYLGYKDIMSGDMNTLYKMKELWGFFCENFDDSHKVYKKIKKCQKCSDYENIISTLKSSL